MIFSSADACLVAGLLAEAARAEIMPRFRRLDPGAIRSKSGPLDLVTDADDAAERAIAAGLRKHFPGCAVIGEEAASADMALLGAIATAELCFIVDPIDGTANYAAGLPLFGCMAAVTMRGTVVAAMIHDPVGRDTAMALRGEGAWTEGEDGRRTDLRVAPAVPMDRMSGAVSWRYMPEGRKQIVCRNLPRLGASFDLRCAAHQYRLLAGGHCHYMVFNRLLPWDHAPGWLLHREAGGFSRRFDDSEYAAADPTGGLICTPDEAGYRALRAALLEI